jgi:hypothetical protein
MATVAPCCQFFPEMPMNVDRNSICRPKRIAKTVNAAMGLHAMRAETNIDLVR